MTTTLDRIPVDEITAQAQQVRFGHTALTVVAAVFFGIGWIVAKAWLSVAWCAVAVKVGFREGRRGVVTPDGPPGPR